MNTNHRTRSKSRLLRYLLPSLTGRGRGVGLFLLSAALSLQVSAYTVTHVAEAPQWQIDWSYNQPRPDWQEPSASSYMNFSVILVTLEEELQPYASNNDLLALFVGDELRGMSGPALDMSTGETDNKHFVVKAYGDESGGDMIDVTLKYYNAQLRQVFSRSTTMAYNPDEVLGIEEDFIPNFTLGSAKYPVVKTIDVADILASAGITPADGDIAAAFVGDECRGVSQLSMVNGQWSMGDGQWSTVNLQCSMVNENETVIVKYYDAARSRVFTFDGSVTGDANGDGKVDVADIATVISVMADGSAGDSPASADVNGDGTVDVADIASIISIMAGTPSSPSEQVSNTRPLTISVTEKPFINPDASASRGTSSVRKAAITTASTLSEFRMDYTYGTTSSQGYRTATKDGEGKWKGDDEGWPYTDATVNWYAHNGYPNGKIQEAPFDLTKDADKKPYLSFTVNNDVAKQKDLLVATATGTWDSTGGNLSFTFDHACSALRFYMKKAKNISDYTLTVTSVQLCNVVNEGNYFFNTASWVPGTTTDNYSIFSGSATLGDTDYTIMDNSDKPYLIVIPQTLTPWNGSASLANTYLELTCTLTKGGSTIHNGTAYIPFAATLKQGTQYDVKINIGKNSLYSAPGTKIIP